VGCSCRVSVAMLRAASIIIIPNLTILHLAERYRNVACLMALVTGEGIFTTRATIYVLEVDRRVNRARWADRACGPLPDYVDPAWVDRPRSSSASV